MATYHRITPFPPSQNDRLTLRRMWPALVGVVVFGVLMALRLEFGSAGGRAAVAACAFVTLFLGIIQPVIVVAGVTLPLWPSALACILLATLSAWLWRLARNRAG